MSQSSSYSVHDLKEQSERSAVSNGDASGQVDTLQKSGISGPATEMFSWDRDVDMSICGTKVGRAVDNHSFDDRCQIELL